jgi:cytochrome b pre-mRNA-processing protein 3
MALTRRQASGSVESMFRFKRKTSGEDLVLRLHSTIVEASRRPSLYGDGGIPDTMEGRFEALVLHALVVLRRLRQLPHPADDVAQELVDALFAHLEIALREMGIGDFGVPKRMKKLAGAFFDRTAKYDPLIAAGDRSGLAAEIGERLALEPVRFEAFAGLILASEAKFSGATLEDLFAGPAFVEINQPTSQATSGTRA